MRVCVTVDRLALSLHGVTAEAAEAAVTGLEEELRRRLGALPAGELAVADAAELAAGPIRSRAVLDPAALRAQLAERLIEILTAGRCCAAAGGGS